MKFLAFSSCNIWAKTPGGILNKKARAAAGPEIAILTGGYCTVRRVMGSNIWKTPLMRQLKQLIAAEDPVGSIGKGLKQITRTGNNQTPAWSN